MSISGSEVITLSTHKIKYRAKVPSYQIYTETFAVTWEMSALSYQVHSLPADGIIWEAEL